MNLINLTPFQAAATIITDKQGYERLLTVVKGTFEMDPDGRWFPASPQMPLVYADEHYGEPGLSSIRSESDFAFFKPHADVLVEGHAHAPEGKTVTSIEVELRLQTVSKKLRVSGDRYWDSLPLAGWVASRPEPFVTLPVVYERSFGGVDTSHADERKHKAERRNLVGTGFHAFSGEHIRGTMLPNIEVPGTACRSPLDQVPVAGFGCISRCWEPRARFAGTYDDGWMEDRYPLLPQDFDDHYFQAAPPDQTCAYLHGGEIGWLRNMSPEGVWNFAVPEYDVPIQVISHSGTQKHAPVIDTLVLLPDQRRCTLTWRALTLVEGKVTSIREIWIGTPTPGRLRAHETGKLFFEQRRDTFAELMP